MAPEERHREDRSAEDGGPDERPVIAEFVDVHRHYVMGKDNVVRALNGVNAFGAVNRCRP